MRKSLVFFFLCLLLFGSFLAFSRLPSRAGSKKGGLNLLFIIIDTLRADRLSCYQSESLKTPNIDRLAEKGILFKKAFAQTSMTLPSHANIFLGTSPLSHGVHDNSTFVVREKFLTLAEHLKNHGYSTAAFVGAYPLDSRFGLSQGFETYDDDYGFQDFEKLAYVERKAEVVIGRALHWLKQQRHPWFLWVHCFDPHAPYEPPEPFRSQYQDRLYDGEVAYIDSALGELFRYLENNNLTQKTLIVFTGDHGESLGEHGEETHGYFAYNSSLRVPLIISFPGAKKSRVDQAASHVDIFPTVCDILNIDQPPFLQGISLLPAIKGKSLPERDVYFESLYPYYSRGWAPLRGFYSGGEKFIDSPIPELYDMNADFDELKNLAQAGSLEKYRKKLAQIMKKSSLPEAEESRAGLDRESRDKLRSLGYISSSPVSQKETFSPEDDVKTLLPYHNRAMRALELGQQGKIDEGIELLESVLKERKNVDTVYSSLAALYKEKGLMKEALGVLKLGLESLPSNYEIFLTYVSFLTSAGQYDEVIRVFGEKSLWKAEHDPEIWNSLGVAHANQGDLEKAITFFEKSLSIDNEYPDAFNNLGSAYLGIFMKTRDSRAYQNAVENFKKAIELDPNHASAYNGLGGAYLQTGDLDGAIGCLERALELKPDFGHALYNLGLAYLGKGDKSKALEYFNTYKKNHGRYLSLGEREKLEALIQQCRKD